MIFDAQVTVVGVEVLDPPQSAEGKIESNAPIMTEITLGLLMPTPQGMVPLPAGRIKFQMGKASAEQIGERMTEVAAMIPDTPGSGLPSDFVVADSAQADAVVKQAEAAKKLVTPKQK